MSPARRRTVAAQDALQGAPAGQGTRKAARGTLEPLAPVSALISRSGAKRNKFGAVKTTVNGIVFDSKAEAGRYQTLVMLQRAGEITGLELQPVFLLTVGSRTVARYYADFRYAVASTGEIVVEDVKSPPTRTPLYRLKKAWAEALYGIRITEVSG